MSSIDAYAAGLLDGEGTISIREERRSAGSDAHILQINIGMTDTRPLEFMRQHYGGAIRGPLPRPNAKHKALYQWQIGASIAETFLLRVRPFLILKAEQADVALRLRATKTRSGVPLPFAVLEERRALKDELRVLNHRGTGPIALRLRRT
jgi:hypothetical protein